MIGESDDLPSEFLSLKARRSLWTEYGVTLPGFDGDDAINALRLQYIEAQRSKFVNKPKEVSRSQYG